MLRPAVTGFRAAVVFVRTFSVKPVVKEAYPIWHVAVKSSDDYFTRRVAHRSAHMARAADLRASGSVIAGGPTPDGKGAHLFYRARDQSEVKDLIEQDPYFTGGVWVSYSPRVFKDFLTPLQLQPPLVVDGSRVHMLLEAPLRVPHISDKQILDVLKDMRLRQQVVFGGIIDDSVKTTFAVMKTPHPKDAEEWAGNRLLWKEKTLQLSPWLYVL